MKHPFLSCSNAVAVEEEKIPVLETGVWREAILALCREEKGRIVALFGLPSEEGVKLFAVVGLDAQKKLAVGCARLTGSPLVYPALTPQLPEAERFERELMEQCGVVAQGHPCLQPIRNLSATLPFHVVAGAGRHEVAVGPVHAGIIEPGHFRFQCHGEKVLKLELQLGYQHRGVENLFLSLEGPRRLVLAESIAGDTAVGHALAYCQALEGLALNSFLPQRGQSLRGIALELERLANHAGDLGALAGDVGFLPSAAYFGRLRGEFLNMLMELSGNRFGRSFVRPGGVFFDLTPEMALDFKKRISAALREIKELAELFFTASSVLARLELTGVVRAEAAKELGLVGPSARASNLSRDIRFDHPAGIYRSHPVEPVRLSVGDVYARARVRSLECKRSLQFIEQRLEALPADKIFQPVASPRPSSFIVSLVEGWRGEIAHLVLTDGEGKIRRYKIVDPSFHNWPALCLAMEGGEISDFPLCNKSFNLSYAGHDL